jgi:hypothetical protein
MRLSAAGTEVNHQCAVAIAATYRGVEAHYGPIGNISDSGKREIANGLYDYARKSFKYEMGKAYGIQLVGAYIESRALPGVDAGLVQDMTSDVVGDVVLRAAQREGDSKSNQYVVQRAIVASKALGANGAREAAEMVNGGPIADDAWGSVREVWEKEWAAAPWESITPRE